RAPRTASSTSTCCRSPARSASPRRTRPAPRLPAPARSAARPRAPCPPPASRLRVVAILRSLKRLGDQRLHGVGGPVHVERQFLVLHRGERLEHEVRRVLATRRAADAEAHA